MNALSPGRFYSVFWLEFSVAVTYKLGDLDYKAMTTIEANVAVTFAK